METEKKKTKHYIRIFYENKISHANYEFISDCDDWSKRQ